MNTATQPEVSALAAEAGIAEDWTGADRRPRRVAPDTLRALLDAMDLPAGSEADIRDSRQRLHRSNRPSLPAPPPAPMARRRCARPPSPATTH
ncbi:hypothetical protein G6F40_015933 [Rhizopus arrhizus]|nr:hypothetical protein G6F40_015933 [Rhizopus arrhizus]